MNANTPKHLKPYALVWVTVATRYSESGNYRYVGEVMSYPLPDNHIMVRVPNHPGTLDEVAIDDVSPLDAHHKPRWVSYAIVKGTGQFPVDMLRYDSCRPVNFVLTEQYSGMRAVVRTEMGYGTDLIVARCDERAHPRWTPARWSSFLWQIQELKTENIGGNRG